MSNSGHMKRAGNALEDLDGVLSVSSYRLFFKKFQLRIINNYNNYNPRCANMPLCPIFWVAPADRRWSCLDWGDQIEAWRSWMCATGAGLGCFVERNYELCFFSIFQGKTHTYTHEKPYIHAPLTKNTLNTGNDASESLRPGQEYRGTAIWIRGYLWLVVQTFGCLWELIRIYVEWSSPYWPGMLYI